jgi:hypothetical protein
MYLVVSSVKQCYVPPTWEPPSPGCRGVEGRVASLIVQGGVGGVPSAPPPAC